MKRRFGENRCRVNFTIVGLTDSTKEEFNKLKAKEGKHNDEIARD